MPKTSFLCISIIIISFLFLGACKRKDNVTLKQTVSKPHRHSNNLRDPFKSVVPLAVSNTQAKATTRASIKEIQAALKNAGFYEGAIDGAMDKNLILAIRAFQQSHKLVADGKVGTKTWQILSQYSR